MQFNQLPSNEKSARAARAMSIGAAVFCVALAAAAAFLMAKEAHAGGGMGSFSGATEVTQIMNNAELAIQTVEQRLQSITQIEQLYYNKLQQLKESIGKHTAPFQKAYEAYEKVQATRRRLEAFKGNLETMQTGLENRFKEYAASKLDWKTWVQREGQLIKDGNARAIAQVKANQQVLQATQDSMKAYQEAAKSMEETTGTHQATRMLGAQLTLLGGDINKLITLTAVEGAERALERQEAVAKKQGQADALEDYKKRQAALDEAFKAQIQKAGGGGK